jgi:hypothetical protein
VAGIGITIPNIVARVVIGALAGIELVIKIADIDVSGWGDWGAVVDVAKIDHLTL